jgi:ribosomal RNA-processing protein 8
MFAVPGWSVSSSALKTQTIVTIKSAANGTTSIPPSGEAATKANKKRKRNNGKSKASDVNSSNVAELYETLIEGKAKPKINKHVEKRQKIVTGGPDVEDQDETTETTAKSKQLKKKKQREETNIELNANATLETSCPNDTKVRSAATKTQQTLAKAVPKLTPLQASMRQKLVSARFRHLNQTLYTTPSAHSLSLFEQSPEMFTEYHEGFRRQVEVWPENPVDGYIRIIKARGKIRGPVRNKGGAASDSSPEVLALPRTEGTCNIADLGCGDAALSAALQKDSKKLHLKIHSFDLHSPSPLVTRADIADLPLGDGSVDIAIFCLALMGTNWVDFIEEAFRILRWKGELWIAEIKSRFGRVGNKGRVEHSVGNRQKKAPVPSKKDKRKVEDEEAEGNDATLMAEVDGNDDMKQATDVSAFVEVLRKRGFVLKAIDSNGEKPVDLSNKMFVKIHFVKGSTPIKGKGVPVPKGMSEMGLETWKQKPKAKFLDGEGDVLVSREAGVLKPCVYKLR